MASTRTTALVLVGLLAAVAVVLLVVGGVGNDDRSDRNHGAVTPAAASPSAVTPSSPPGGSSPGASAHPAPSPRSEVLPDADEPQATSSGYSLPPVPTADPTPLLGPSSPKSAVARGRLVKGFPVALSPPRRAKVVSSTISVRGGALQVALTASGSDPQTVLLHYRDVLGVRGYTERAGQGVENAPAAAFSKGPNSVTISIVDGQTYLLAHLAAGQQ